MFLLSAIVKFLLRTETLLLIVLVAACALHFLGKVAAARRLVYAIAIVLLILTVFPLGDVLLQPLQTAYRNNPEVEGVGGIIVLGGSELELETAQWDQPNTNDGGDRYINAIVLAERYPTAKIVFAGGGSEDFLSEADVAEMIFTGAGIAPDRLVLEKRSRNTVENARNAKALVENSESGSWLLVTSAAHMPRALASFCAAGWHNLIPWPTDYRSTESYLNWNLVGNLSSLNSAINEWVGLLGYRILGRTNDIFSKGC